MSLHVADPGYRSFEELTVPACGFKILDIFVENSTRLEYSARLAYSTF
jgi:hypothetical protein